MMLKIDTCGKLFQPAEAERVAKTLEENDQDWSYVVRHDPKGTGYSFVEVYDEDGEFIGKV